MLRGATSLRTAFSQLRISPTVASGTASSSCGDNVFRDNMKLFELYRSNPELPNDLLQKPQVPPGRFIINGISSLILPSTSTSQQSKITPPHVRPIAVEAPADRVLEKFDPLSNIVPVRDPTIGHHAPMYAGVRMLVIRRKKMRKFKRKKHEKRDRFILEKIRLRKEAKAEALFCARMQEMRTDLETFDAMQYVKGVIKNAERQWESKLAPSGKKKYGHWSEVISLEELYGIPASTYIDKRAGLICTPEDRAKFQELRGKYYASYMRKKGTSKK